MSFWDEFEKRATKAETLLRALKNRVERVRGLPRLTKGHDRMLGRQINRHQAAEIKFKAALKKDPSRNVSAQEILPKRGPHKKIIGNQGHRWPAFKKEWEHKTQWMRDKLDAQSIRIKKKEDLQKAVDDRLQKAYKK